MSIPRPGRNATPHQGPQPHKFHLPLRNFLILLVATGASVGTDLLLGGAGATLGQAVIGACTAFAATLHFLDKILE